MERIAAPGSVMSRFPGRRLIAGSAVAVALVAALVTGVSANSGAGGGGRGDITITAINGTQLSLATADGWTRTLDAAGVKVVNGDATITVGDLKVGETIALAEARNFDGTVAVTQISVVAPNVEGTVTAVNGSTLTIKQAGRDVPNGHLTATTTYSVNGAASNQAAITVGSDVNVEGTANADGSFTATSVSAHPASISGTVTATTADSITIADPSGATATIKVSASTTYRTASGTGSIADAVVGAVVRAEGVRNADGTFTATTVDIGTANGASRVGGGRGGHGHGGPGDGGPGTMVANGAPSGPTGASGASPSAPAASPSAPVSPSANPSPSASA